MIKQFARRAFLALLCGTVGLFSASAAPYTPGDLFVGFRASDGAGSTKDYLVNLGSSAQFASTGSPTTLSLGNLGADLSSGALFGAGWQNRPDVFWGISGTTGSFAAAAGSPAKTLFATRARLTPVNQSVPWDRASDTAQGVITSKMNSLAEAYKLGVGTGNSAAGVIQNTTETNSYASFQPGGTLPNSGPAPGVSFSAFNPSNEASFRAGSAAAVLDLYKMIPAGGTSTGPGEYLGFFIINDAATITFVPASISTISLETSSLAVSEEVVGGQLTVNVFRGGNTSIAATVNVASSAGTATAPIDYTELGSTTLSFAPGETLKQVSIAVAFRPGFQGNRTFNLTLSAASGGSFTAPIATAVVTILETSQPPDGVLSFSADKISFPPFNSRGTPNVLAVTINRANPTAATVTVNVTVTGGSMVQGTDYTLASPASVFFAANAATATLNIPLTTSGTLNLPRTITLALSNPSGTATIGAISSTTLTVGILGSASFSATSYTTGELPSGDKVLNVIVNRTGGSNGAATVDVARTGGTATAGTDFTATLPATVSWADGDSSPKMVPITIKPDAVADGGETILLALQNANGLALGTPITTTVTIFDPDTTAPTLTITSPKVNQKFIGAGVLVSGVAKDNQAIERVEVRMDNGETDVITPSGFSTTFNFRKSVIPEQGRHVLKIIAFDVVGNASKPVLIPVIFTNLRPRLVGSYNGLIAGTPGLGTSRTHGFVTLTINVTGSFTGKVNTGGGAPRPITGIIGATGDARFGRTGVKQFAIPGSGFLALTADLKGGRKVTGTLRSGPSPASTTVGMIFHADLAVYGPFKRVPAALAGKYTAIFQADDAPNNGLAATSFPQGDGYAMVTVMNTGSVMMIGKLADGSAFTYANVLAGSGDWPVHAALYRGRGFLNGNVVFDRRQPQTDASCGDMRWFKSAGSVQPPVPGVKQQRAYGSGWPNGITVDFAASKYNAAGNPLGAGVSAVTITLADGGIATATSNDGTAVANGRVSIGGATAGTTPPATGAVGLNAKVTPKTGALTGSFIHPSAGKVSFEGVAYQKRGGAAGFFIFQPGPAGTSGGVSITKKP